MAAIVLEATEIAIRRGDVDVLRGASLTVRAGERWVLSGPNGGGKTTLLELLARERPPDDGAVRLAPGIEVAFVRQRDPRASAATLGDLAASSLASLRRLERELESLRRSLEGAAAGASAEALAARFVELLALFEERGGFTADARLGRMLDAFGVDASAADTPTPTATASLRRRALLAGALASGAELVLLDEPTNGLDLPSRIVLADVIRGHRAAFVVATHDRAFADRMGTHVAVLEHGRLDAARGSLSSVLDRRAQARHAEGRAQRERRRRADELERMAQELARHGHRTAQVRKRRAERERRSLLDTLAAADAAARELPVPAPLDLGAARPDRRRTGHVLMRGRHLSIPGVLDDVAVELARGDRIALVGASGSGRSTLLEVLAGERPSADARAEVTLTAGARLAWSDRATRGVPDAQSPRSALESWVGAERAASLLRLAGLPRASWERAASALSGGERARAGLALLVAREPDLILLDEPTDDLDLQGVLTLEETLVSSAATMVIATHDQRLVEALGAEVWSIEDGELVRYRGGMSGYRRGARRLEPGVAGDPAPERDRSAPEPLAADGVAPDRGAAADASGSDGRTDQEAIEDALAAIERALLDPAAHGERDRARLRRHRRTLEERYLEHLDATMPPPRPRFSTREAGTTVWADRDGDELSVWLDGGPGVRVRVVGSVAHLVPVPGVRRPEIAVPQDALPEAAVAEAAVADVAAELLPWAERALLRAAARLAHYLLDVDVVQVASTSDLGDAGFTPLGPGWWTLHARDLERQEGWRHHAGRRRSRSRRRSRPR